MSYSRWVTSTWYTFWQSQPDETENRYTAIFNICDFLGDTSFTAEELRNNIDKCVDMVKEKYYDYKLPESDYIEIKGYMMRFLEDVDEEYPQNK